MKFAADEDEKRRSREAKVRADRAIVDQRVNAILEQESLPRRPPRSKLSKTRNPEKGAANNNDVKTSVNLMKKIDPDLFKYESTHTDVGAYAVRNVDERGKFRNIRGLYDMPKEFC